MKFDSLWEMFIRPYRQDYSLLDLGNEVQVFGQFKSRRSDVVILNKNQQKLQCSLFEPMLCTQQTPLQKYPCVVYSHTNSGSRLEALRILPDIIKRGMGLFCFDFAGSGLSDGDYVTLGINESLDLECVIAYLIEKQKVSNITLWGRSMGAVTNITYAAKNLSHKYVKAIIFDSGFSNLRVLARDIAKQKTGFPNLIIEPALSLIGDQVKERVQHDISSIDLAKVIHTIYVPCYFLTSKDDTFVKSEHVEQLHMRYNGQKWLQYISGEHNAHRSNALVDQLVSWIASMVFDQSTTNSTATTYETSTVAAATNEVIPKNLLDTHANNSSSNFIQQPRKSSAPIKSLNLMRKNNTIDSFGSKTSSLNTIPPTDEYTLMSPSKSSSSAAIAATVQATINLKIPNSPPSEHEYYDKARAHGIQTIGSYRSSTEGTTQHYILKQAPTPTSQLSQNAAAMLKQQLDTSSQPQSRIPTEETASRTDNAEGSSLNSNGYRKNSSNYNNQNNTNSSSTQSFLSIANEDASPQNTNERLSLPPNHRLSLPTGKPSACQSTYSSSITLDMISDSPSSSSITQQQSRQHEGNKTTSNAVGSSLNRNPHHQHFSSFSSSPIHVRQQRDSPSINSKLATEKNEQNTTPATEIEDHNEIDTPHFKRLIKPQTAQIRLSKEEEELPKRSQNNQQQQKQPDQQQQQPVVQKEIVPEQIGIQNARSQRAATCFNNPVKSTNAAPVANSTNVTTPQLDSKDHYKSQQAIVVHNEKQQQQASQQLAHHSQSTQIYSHRQSLPSPYTSLSQQGGSPTKQVNNSSINNYQMEQQQQNSYSQHVSSSTSNNANSKNSNSNGSNFLQMPAAFFSTYTQQSTAKISQPLTTPLSPPLTSVHSTLKNNTQSTSVMTTTTTNSKAPLTFAMANRTRLAKASVDFSTNLLVGSAAPQSQPSFFDKGLTSTTLFKSPVIQHGQQSETSQMNNEDRQTVNKSHHLQSAKQFAYTTTANAAYNNSTASHSNLTYKLTNNNNNSNQSPQQPVKLTACGITQNPPASSLQTSKQVVKKLEQSYPTQSTPHLAVPTVGITIQSGEQMKSPVHQPDHQQQLQKTVSSQNFSQQHYFSVPSSANLKEPAKQEKLLTHESPVKNPDFFGQNKVLFKTFDTIPQNYQQQQRITANKNPQPQLLHKHPYSVKDKLYGFAAASATAVNSTPAMNNQSLGSSPKHRLL